MAVVELLVAAFSNFRCGILELLVLFFRIVKIELVEVISESQKPITDLKLFKKNRAQPKLLASAAKSRLEEEEILECLIKVVEELLSSINNNLLI